MNAQEIIRNEERLRPRYAVIAGIGGIALFGSAVLQAVGPQPKVSELTLELITTNRRAGLEVAGAIVNGIGLVALGLTLALLFRAARARMAESGQTAYPGSKVFEPGAFPRLSAVAGAVFGAIGGIAYGVVLAVKSHQFVMRGGQTYVEAHHLVGGGGLAALQYLGLAGSLLLAIGFVLVSLNAMRTGLLSRFLGYLGMVAGAASLLLIGSAPALLVEVFWLMAMAYLLSGRWPSEPEAWRRGEAVPWPSAAEVREQRQRAGTARGSAPSKPAARAPSQPPRQSSQPTATATRTRASTPKRKRKRRK